MNYSRKTTALKVLDNLFSSDIIRTMKKQNTQYIIIDLYDGGSEMIPASEAKQATKGLKKIKGDVNVWRGEEYMVVEVLA